MGWVRGGFCLTYLTVDRYRRGDRPGDLHARGLKASADVIEIQLYVIALRAPGDRSLRSLHASLCLRNALLPSRHGGGFIGTFRIATSGSLSGPRWLTCRGVARERRPDGIRWPDDRPGGSVGRSGSAFKTLRRLWSGGHERKT